MLTNVDEFVDRRVPPHLFEYALKNNTNWFWYKTAFEKGKNKENPIAVTYTKNWVFKTEFELPGMLRWSEVVEYLPMQEVSPIVTTVAMLQEKNWTYEMMWKRLDEAPKSVNLNDLEQALTGVVLPTVGGGIPKIEEAFLTDEYAGEHPGNNQLIMDLKREIVKQITIIDKLLPHLGELTTNRELFEVMLDEHCKTRKRVNSIYGESSDDLFKVSVDA